MYILFLLVLCGLYSQMSTRSPHQVYWNKVDLISSPILERIRQINIRQLVRQIGGCTSTLSAWLGGKQDGLPVLAIWDIRSEKRKCMSHNRV
jgi:hypothetical protein